MKYDKDILYDLYIIQKKSLREIADLFDTIPQNIHYYFKKFDIPRRDYSESLAGRKFIEEWKAKIAESLSGHKLSKETKEKISKKNKGKASKLKGLSKCKNPDLIKSGKSGEDHWNWKGGVSDSNNRIRQSSEYLDWRRACLIRDNFTCCFCNNRSSKGNPVHLNVHHIIPFFYLVENNKFLFDLENGITLCRDCHKKCHKKQKFHFET